MGERFSRRPRFVLLNIARWFLALLRDDIVFVLLEGLAIQSDASPVALTALLSRNHCHSGRRNFS